LRILATGWQANGFDKLGANAQRLTPFFGHQVRSKVLVKTGFGVLLHSDQCRESRWPRLGETTHALGQM